MYKIPLIKPYVTEELKDRVAAVLESGYLTEGPVTHQLEKVFCDYIGGGHVVALSSCTVGLELALRACGIGHGDEVIVPDYTYPATADVAAIVGARIVLVDIDRNTMLVDYEKLEQAVTENTKAVIPVSLFGNPLNHERLQRLKNQYNLMIIEDAACAIGAEYKSRKAGTHADISVFSLHPRKFITSGEGGILTTDNAGYAEWIRSYKHFGMGVSPTREGTTFERIGTNYKLSDVLAAIAVSQMNDIDKLLEQRTKAAAYYRELLEDDPRVTVPAVTEGGRHSYQSFCIYIEKRDTVMRGLRQKGIEVQIGTYSLHMHKAFQDDRVCRIAGPLDGSVYAFNHCLALPLFYDITEAEQEEVVNELRKLL
ncbi:MAG: DegT/DnrJ/EryC1/StrS aminotransferase family protein [Spirochaetales bacterium]|nr:DegT/DnrJ/EryC1/StrS aminotransferase family protein [Spirochaetales bacterium]